MLVTFTLTLKIMIKFINMNELISQMVLDYPNAPPTRHTGANTIFRQTTVNISHRQKAHTRLLYTLIRLYQNIHMII